MGRVEAKKRAQSGMVTVGELRAIIAKVADRPGYSRLNPAIPMAKAIEIYSAVLEGMPDDARPVTMKTDPYSRVGKLLPTRWCLTISNILRDCA